MAKKTKKSYRGPRLSEAQRYRPEAKVGAAAPVSQPVVASVVPADADLMEEYRYVLTDLKRIAWLAVAMLALLIVLAFIIV
ncbi:MAG TPA: hypothetical protein PLJ78_17005 [Anaerolineae bacterium]|nr:hypothetical protein [Anaerolineae bacterium]HQK15631.1 hypothetical protein [Anaerolineae bacterium]